MTEHHVKIPLPRFLKLLTGNNVPVPKAMAVAGKMSVLVSLCHGQTLLSVVHIHRYKEYNTPARLAQLTEVRLSAAGVENKDDRKLVMTALRKAGHIPKEAPRKKLETTADDAPVAGPSTPSTSGTVQAVVCYINLGQVCRPQFPSLR